MLGSLRVRGRGGRSLNEEWGEEEARAYAGVTVPGYPNFFYTTGPNTAPNHAAGQNIVSEAQIHYIIECLDAMVRQDVVAMEPRQEAFDAWNDEIGERMKIMIWTHPKADSYYNNSKKRIYLSWPYPLVDQWYLMRAPKLEDFLLSPATQKAEA